MTAEEYEIWGRPFDLKILEAVREATFNVLHIHGKRIHFDPVLDYPVSALKWLHFATTPSLREGKMRSSKTVLGGIDEATASQVSAPEIGEQVDNAIREVGTRGLIVTPGCSVPTDTREQNLREVKAPSNACKNKRGSREDSYREMFRTLNSGIKCEIMANICAFLCEPLIRDDRMSCI